MTDGKKPRKAFKWWHLLIAFFVFNIGLVAYFAPPPTPPKIKTPADLAAEKNSSARSLLALNAIKMIKKSAKDPDSVKFTSLHVNESGDIVCAEFRAKNSFGAVVPTIYTASLKHNIDSTNTKEWNKYCQKNMYDMSPLYR